LRHPNIMPGIERATDIGLPRDTRRGFTGFAFCAICAVTGFVATDASAADNPPTAVTPGVTRKLLSQMDGPMPGYVTINMEVEVEAGVMVARHTHPELNPVTLSKAAANSLSKVNRPGR
jgi:hypothetical protein